MRSGRLITDDRLAGRTGGISDHRNDGDRSPHRNKPGATPERDIGDASRGRVLERKFGSLRVYFGDGRIDSYELGANDERDLSTACGTVRSANPTRRAGTFNTQANTVGVTTEMSSNAPAARSRDAPMQTEAAPAASGPPIQATRNTARASALMDGNAPKLTMSSIVAHTSEPSSTARRRLLDGDFRDNGTGQECPVRVLDASVIDGAERRVRMTGSSGRLHLMRSPCSRNPGYDLGGT